MGWLNRIASSGKKYLPYFCEDVSTSKTLTEFCVEKARMLSAAGCHCTTSILLSSRDSVASGAFNDAVNLPSGGKLQILTYNGKWKSKWIWNILGFLYIRAKRTSLHMGSWRIQFNVYIKQLQISNKNSLSLSLWYKGTFTTIKTNIYSLRVHTHSAKANILIGHCQHIEFLKNPFERVNKPERWKWTQKWHRFQIDFCWFNTIFTHWMAVKIKEKSRFRVRFCYSVQSCP